MSHRNVSLFVPHLGCPHNCIFCNQKTISGKCGILSKDEIINACEIAINSNYDINDSEIAFFGGSFTAIDKNLMVEYLKTVQAYIGKYFKGIRISTRPDCINSEILSVLKYYNVTAIELGAQSTNNEVIRLNERGHTFADTVNACNLIKKSGISLGLQMMTGLYGSDRTTDLKTALDFIDLKPDTVRIYPTVVLRNTALEDLYHNGLYSPPTIDECVSLCAELLIRFYKHNIKVIRIGLHSGGNVDDGYIAGVYHPAFGELCMSRIYRNLIDESIHEAGDYNVKIPSGEKSKAVGQHRSNIKYFAEKGFNITFCEDPSLYKYQIKLDK